MAKAGPTSVTAAQAVLLGASDLSAEGQGEFSEWDLTVATWKRNPNRFGCRGYESQYPDHKRVMMEIMGTKKKENPIRKGWFEKVRQNTYRLTNIGITEADRLKRDVSSDRKSVRSPQAIYDAVAPLYKNNAFRKHSRDADEPRMWLGAASFFQLTSGEPQHLEDRLRATEATIANALEWMDENQANQIQRGVSGGSESISKDSLLKLKGFYETLLQRFSNQIEAVKKAKR
jgi:hypothetical protein